MGKAPIVSVALVFWLIGCSSTPSRPRGEGGAGDGEGGGGEGGAGGSAGSGGLSGAGRDAAIAAPPDAERAADVVAPDLASPTVDAPPPAADVAVSTQGPTAAGRIVFSQDFEQGMAGMSRSPTNLPVDRVQIVDDPLNQRGKVARVVYQQGDDFRTSGGTQPRSWLSSADGYQIAVGTKISLAWGMMWPELETNAFFAQTIGPGPVWELRFLADGRFNVLCNKCGRNSYHMVPTRQANRWLDLRVDMDWRNGGLVQFYVDGQMVHQATLSGADANCHWDGGIYWATDAPARPTRTVYISNLSIGVRD